jgi:hypothetical protein
MIAQGDLVGRAHPPHRDPLDHLACDRREVHDAPRPSSDHSRQYRPVAEGDAVRVIAIVRSSRR